MNTIKALGVCLITLLFQSNALALSEDDILAPQEAFAPTVNADASGRNLSVHFDIQEGYYLYRDKIAVTPETDAIILGALNSPAGDVKQDEFFGEVETYRGPIDVNVAVQQTTGETADITVKYQGCADIGICYPPTTQTFRVDLAAFEAPALPASSSSGLPGAFAESFGSDDFLSPEQAFKIGLTNTQQGEIEISFDIAEGYYLYKDKVTATADDSLEHFSFTLPDGEVHEDEFFGRTETYRYVLTVPASYTKSDTQFGDSLIEIGYQGCADEGLCYPPMTKSFSLALAAANPQSDTAPDTLTTSPSPVTTTSVISEQDSLAAKLAENGIWTIILTFFGLGLLLAFTPCVFPMIPILSSLIVGQGEEITTKRSLLLSLVYVLAMALTYTVAGIIVGLSGENVQALFQNPWVLSAFAALFVALSLSMFGFYELQMPSAIQSRLTNLSNKQKGGTLGGVAIMGFLSALIVGPCVTAPLVGALIYIAQTGDAITGGLALFSLSIGMGVPLILIGMSAGKFLPRAGAWMDVTKAVFGVLLLGVAIWMMDRVLPFFATMMLVATLIIVCGIYLGAFEQVDATKSRWRYLWKGIGLIAVIYGTLIMIGASAGGQSLITPLKGVFSSGSDNVNATEGLRFRQIKGLEGLNAALKEASAREQSIMLDFYADWCVSCKEMEHYTFTDPRVIETLSETLLIQADVTANDEDDKALLKHFGLFGPPAILFFNAQGAEMKSYRVMGYMDADTFSAQAAGAIK